MAMQKQKQIEPFYEELGANIRFYRDQLGMSQRALGEALQPKAMTRAGIANIEGGGQRVLAYTLTQIANRLNVAIEKLIPNQEQVQRPAEMQAVERELKQKLNLKSSTLKEITREIRQTNKAVTA